MIGYAGAYETFLSGLELVRNGSVAAKAGAGAIATSALINDGLAAAWGINDNTCCRLDAY
jgi:hypothetical protein